MIDDNRFEVFLFSAAVFGVAVGIGAIFDRPELKSVTKITYTKDIKPLVMKRCMPCHDGSLPWPPNFTKYKSAFSHHKRMEFRAWKRRTMPPGGVYITDDERTLIKEWSDQGAPE